MGSSCRTFASTSIWSSDVFVIPRSTALMNGMETWASSDSRSWDIAARKRDETNDEATFALYGVLSGSSGHKAMRSFSNVSIETFVAPLSIRPTYVRLSPTALPNVAWVNPHAPRCRATARAYDIRNELGAFLFMRATVAQARRHCHK